MRKCLAIGMFILAASTMLQAQLISGTVKSGYNCGRITDPTNCYGLLVTFTDANGTHDAAVWLDKGSRGNTTTGAYSFLKFTTDPLGFGLATITSPYVHLQTGTGMFTVAYAFSGFDSAGKAYEGSLSINYTTYYSSGGGGKGGAGAGYRWVTAVGGKIGVVYPVNASDPTIGAMLSKPGKIPGVTQPMLSVYSWCGNEYPIGSCPIWLGGPLQGFQWFSLCHPWSGGSYPVVWCSWSGSNCPCP